MPPDDHEGPRLNDEGIDFHLSRKEPSRELLWTAVAFGVAIVFAWAGGKIDTIYMLVFLGLFGAMYAASWYDETNAEADRSIKLRISAKGIEIPEKFSRLMPWQDVKSLTMSTHKGTTTLHVAALNPSEYGITETGWTRFLHGAGVAYNITPLEGTEDDVRVALRRFAPQELTKGI